MIVLSVLDGMGIGPAHQGNAITQARLQNLEEIKNHYPGCSLQASGISVGLTWGEPGNSEAGHLTIGAGKIVYQYLPSIIFSIRDESFFKNPALLGAINHAQKNNSTLHLMGLLSSGGVHAYIDHFYALLELCKRNGVRAKIHVFTDGRDAPPNEAAKFLKSLIERLQKTDTGEISTIIGRSFAMDRDEKWEKTEKTYRLLTEGLGEKIDDPISHIEASYKKRTFDELIEPAICKTTIGKPEDSLIKDNDAVIFFNYREDSARQITKAFIEPSFSKFERRELNNLYFCTMTKYLKSLPAHVAFEPPEINYPLGLVLAESGKRQLKIAETEKYAHVTFFFNGLREKPFIGEDRILIPSIPESQLEKSPEMSIKELSVQAQKAIRSGNYDFILINFANPDVLGHTGNLEACIKGLEIMDICLGEIKNAVLEMNGTMLITADHGNCEEMLNPYTGVPDTEHSINPVLFYVVNSDFKKEKTEQEIDWEQSEPHGFLSDIAPTILTMMNLPIPKEMTGKNLLPYIAKSL